MGGPTVVQVICTVWRKLGSTPGKCFSRITSLKQILAEHGAGCMMHSVSCENGPVAEAREEFNMVKSAVVAINFIEFKRAMAANTKAAGKAKVYYVDYMSNKINIETFFQALKELDKEHSFIVNNDMDAVVCGLNAEITSAARATYDKKIAK